MLAKMILTNNKIQFWIYFELFPCFRLDCLLCSSLLPTTLHFILSFVICLSLQNVLVLTSVLMSLMFANLAWTTNFGDAQRV